VRDDLTTRAAELRAGRVPFVHARVVLAERPTSAKPGDEALVLADGTIEGFVGGTCAEATVRERAVPLLDTGESLVVRITPVDADEPEPIDHAGRVVVHNPCLSGGTVEVFLEPEVPPPLVLVVGQAPIARALQTIGSQLHYDVRAYEGTLPADTTALVVASHGRGEEPALTAAVQANVPYVGLVASKKRGATVVATLDLPDAGRARVRTPAGLDIGAHTPEEVALSILAEIVSTRPSVPPPQRSETAPEPAPPTAIDPVCGMRVVAAPDALRYEQDGQVWRFCGSGCLRAFQASPDAYR
jgi:xanthine dehydrogenase accessory factor